MGLVFGGNSASLQWALRSFDTGRINNLRLGESILLGRDSLDGTATDRLFIDAITLVGEVIESKVKPSRPYGQIMRTGFDEIRSVVDNGLITQTILAIGHQDTDPKGLLHIL